MDDDLTFGASVWATSEPITSKQPLVAAKPEQEAKFDDEFDDFGTPADTTQGDINDDNDFGDFGDFGEAEPGSLQTFTEHSGFDDVRIAGPSSQIWQPLRLDPFPPRSTLESAIDETWGPIWNYEDIADVTTDDPIREAEGIAQILITPSRWVCRRLTSLSSVQLVLFSSSRAMYKSLLQTPPPTKPPNWTRSRIRRQHLITLGIPVNLDEVLPRAGGKPLPPLEIHTRPMSTPPENRNNASGSRDVTPKPGEQAVFAQFGPKPELDMAKINKLLQLNAGMLVSPYKYYCPLSTVFLFFLEQLTMQPLANVERHLAEIKSQTANTSKLLTYLLQSRDALQQDSETYNGLIAEMVGQAQSLRSGKPPRTASIRRGNSGLS